MHSTRSDGTDSPTRAVEIAAAAGLSAISLTDHDTTDGLYGFLVIPESAAGTKQADPVPGTAPQYYVYVDTQQPTVQVTRAEAGPGGASSTSTLSLSR